MEELVVSQGSGEWRNWWSHRGVGSGGTGGLTGEWGVEELVVSQGVGSGGTGGLTREWGVEELVVSQGSGEWRNWWSHRGVVRGGGGHTGEEYCVAYLEVPMRKYSFQTVLLHKV